MWHLGKNVCLTILLFDGLFVHPFVCSYTVLCMFLSVCLSTSSYIICICVRLSVCPSVCPSVRLYATFYVILFVTLIVCMFSFRSLFRPSERPFVLSSSVRMVMHACKSVV